MADAATLRRLAETEVSQEIPKEIFGPVLMSSPFVYVDGTFNTRDLGQLPNSPLRPGFAYRSGMLSKLSDSGKATLRDKLGIKRVFDLRSPEERAHAPEPVIEGIENTWIQSTSPDTPPALSSFVSGGGEEGYRDMYMEFIDTYRPTWKAILEHVRDRPEEPFLYHCTAGRDRTGVFSDLLLTLAGAPDETVELDYLLTRIGTEAVRPLLLQVAMTETRAESQDQPGFYNLCSLRASSWKAFTDAVQKKYGGVVEFARQELGLSEEDLARIKKNATSPKAQNGHA